MDLTPTRTSLHAVAELLLAGPQYAASGTIALRVLPVGIATVRDPDLRLEGAELVGPAGRHPLVGTIAEVARAAGVEPRSLDDVYSGGPAVAVEDHLAVDPEHLAVLTEALALGDAALAAFAPEADRVLWPEHLDVAISLDEVNFGVSPGDDAIAVPYAYVGPWAARSGAFWDQPFGAARAVADLGTVDAVVAFFREGAERARTDPSAP